MIRQHDQNSIFDTPETSVQGESLDTNTVCRSKNGSSPDTTGPVADFISMQCNGGFTGVSRDNPDLERLRRRKNFALHEASKIVYDAKTLPFYVEAFQCPTHYKTKRDGKTVFLKSDKRPTSATKPTHCRIDCPWGVEYVPYRAGGHITCMVRPKWILDKDNVLFRESLPYENATHIRIYHPFYRLGACQSLIASTRPRYTTGFDQPLHWLQLNGEHGEKSADLKTVTFENGVRHASITGMCRCDGPSICVECGRSLTDLKAAEVNAGLLTAIKKGYFVFFITWTIRHQKTDKLQALMNALVDARHYCKSAARGKVLKGDFGYLGCIRGFEYTWTTLKGHHPHIHDVFVLDKMVSPAELRSFLMKHYNHRLKFKHAARFQVGNKYTAGIDVQPCLTFAQYEDYVTDSGKVNLSSVNELARYQAKGIDVDKSLDRLIEDELTGNNRDNWGLGQEITKGYLKSNKNGYKGDSYNYVGLLNRWLQEFQAGNKEKSLFFRDLLKEYATCFRGLSTCYWSPGLKQLLDVPEISHEEFYEQTDLLHDELVKSFSVHDIATIVKHKLQIYVREIAEDNPKDKAADLIQKLLDSKRE